MSHLHDGVQVLALVAEHLQAVDGARRSLSAKHKRLPAARVSVLHCCRLPAGALETKLLRGAVTPPVMAAGLCGALFSHEPACTQLGRGCR